MSDRSDDQRLHRSKTFSYDIMEDGDIRVKMDRTMSTSESPIPPRYIYYTMHFILFKIK